MMISKAFVFISFLLCSNFLFGQVEGSITDESEHAIANARVTALDVKGIIADTATSDERGFYAFSKLKKGSYTIRAKATGFQNSIKENVKVIVEIEANKIRNDVTGVTRLNFILKAGKSFD